MLLVPSCACSPDLAADDLLGRCRARLLGPGLVIGTRRRRPPLASASLHPSGQGRVAVAAGQPPAKRSAQRGAPAPAIRVAVAFEVAGVMDALQQRPGHFGRLRLERTMALRFELRALEATC